MSLSLLLQPLSSISCSFWMVCNIRGKQLYRWSSIWRGLNQNTSVKRLHQTNWIYTSRATRKWEKRSIQKSVSDYYFHSMQVFHVSFDWSLSNSKSSQLSRTRLSILTDLNSAIVWMVLILPLNSNFPIQGHQWQFVLPSLTCSTDLSPLYHYFFFNPG